MSASGLRVAVVTVTYNSADALSPFLSSLPGAFADVPYALVVADNSSRDDSVAIVREHDAAATVLQLPTNDGYAAGINAAIAAAPRTDAVLIANPDTRLQRGCIGSLLAALDEPGVGITVPRLVDEHNNLQYSLRRDATVARVLGEAFLGGRRARRYAHLSRVVGNDDAYGSTGEVEWASGALLLISRACLDACGPWDESFFLYSEEEEFEQRARRRGFRIRYVPDAHAVHVGGEMHRSPELWALGVVNSLRLYARDHGVLSTTAYRGALVCNELLRVRGPAHRRALRALLSRDALTPGARP